MQLSELLLPLRGTSLREGSRTADGCKAASSILHRGSKHRGPHSVTEPPHRGGCHEVTGGVRQDAAGHSTPQALRASSPSLRACGDSSPSLRRCAPVLTPQSPTVTAPHPSVTYGDSSPRGGAKDQNKKLPAGSRNTKKAWRIGAGASSNPPGNLLLRSHSLLSSIPHFSDDTLHVIAGFSFCCGKGMLDLTRSLVSKPHLDF